MGYGLRVAGSAGAWANPLWVSPAMRARVPREQQPRQRPEAAGRDGRGCGDVRLRARLWRRPEHRRRCAGRPETGEEGGGVVRRGGGVGGGGVGCYTVEFGGCWVAGGGAGGVELRWRCEAAGEGKGVRSVLGADEGVCARERERERVFL